MELPTYTNIWKIEKRLYKLYDFRLPMPLPIGQVAAFLAIAVPYILLLTLVGMPFSHTWVWLYVLPPGVLTWLVTRPVLEGKRLPELVLSQVRYLSEPRTWCRMAPFAEAQQIVVTARVWRSGAATVLASAADGSDRESARRQFAPLRVRPEVARERVAPIGYGDAGRAWPSRGGPSGSKDGQGPIAEDAVVEEAPVEQTVEETPVEGAAADEAVRATPIAAAAAEGSAAEASAAEASAAEASAAEAEAAEAPAADAPAVQEMAPDAGETQPSAAVVTPAAPEPAAGEIPVGGIAASDTATLEDAAADADEPERLSAVRVRAHGLGPSGAARAPVAAQGTRVTVGSPPATGDVAVPAFRPSWPGNPAMSAHAVADGRGGPAGSPPPPAAAADQAAESAAEPALATAAKAPDAPADEGSADTALLLVNAAAAPADVAEPQRERKSGPEAEPTPAKQSEPQPPPRVAGGRPAVTITTPGGALEPLHVVERALRMSAGAAGWHDRVVVVPGGHRPGQPDQVQRDQARVRLPIGAPARIVVVGCTSGAGQTTTTLFTAQLMASLRAEPVAVLDLAAGPGSLTELARQVPRLVPGRTGRPLPDRPASAAGRGLQVITADGQGPDGADASSLMDTVVARYPLLLTDPAAVHVPRAVQAADQLVLVAPAGGNAAGALAMTLEWLDIHGNADLTNAAVVVLNGVSAHTESHVEKAATVAAGRCRAIVRVPWDGAHAGTGALGVASVQAYTALAGVLIAGLSGRAVAPTAGAGEAVR